MIVPEKRRAAGPGEGENGMAHGKREKRAEGGVLPWLWLPIAVTVQELTLHLYAFGGEGHFLYVLLFSLAFGGMGDVLCALCPGRGRRILAGILTVLGTLWLGAQAVYFSVFRTFLTLYSVGGAGQVLQFWREALGGMARAWLPLLVILAPAVSYFAWGRRHLPLGPLPGKAVALAAGSTAAVQLLAAVAVGCDDRGALSPRYLYQEEFIAEQSVESFGALTTLRLDVCQLLGIPRGGGAETPDASSGSAAGSGAISAEVPPESPEEPEPIVYADNVMNIDFETLMAGHDATLRKMDEWFASRTPTRQNEYTGYFAGKNLILFTAEGFSRFAVREDVTPTLYRLANSGFVFENFYNPLWWASTTDGEYVACTGLIPKSGCWSLYRAGNNELYFCLGNQFRALGYDTRAYHDHTYTYYNRDVSHPNMGYDYQGVGNGLEVKKTWPESDLEMMQLTLPEYVGDAPFHTYYMTVSGHMNYNYMGNAMSAKHKDEVAHLGLSEAAGAYLACQMELDRALEYTIQYLEETGHLEDTVICLSADHYPYGLEQETLTELNGGESVDMRFDVYRSTLILWSGSMTEPVHVTKPCSSLDILPTLSNLFGLEYDSRLLMGRDVFSDSEGLVVLSDRSFLTETGRYDAAGDTFTPAPGRYASENYVKTLQREINGMFSNSRLILEQDYYRKLGLSHSAK